MDPSHIRNFSVIAHIDHGKSTLADRFLEITGALQAREMEAQVLDAMDLERERGITIKAHPVRLHYTAHDGQKYALNLIDTPGSRRLLLRSDAVAGRVRGRAAARRRLAGRRSADAGQRLSRGREQPRDHPGHQQDRSAERAARGSAPPDRRTSSASTAITRCSPAPRPAPASPEILEAIVARLPPPAGDPDAPLKALIFDSWYDPYRGVVIVVRVIDGVLRPGMKIRLMAEGQDYESLQVGIFTPKATPVEELAVGEVGFLVANIKKISDAKIGDTITESARADARAVPRLQAAEADGLRRASTRSRATSIRSCATRSRSCGSTTRRSSTSRRPRPRSASGSAAASSACCTWRSCRSGSSANSTWTW